MPDLRSVHLPDRTFADLLTLPSGKTSYYVFRGRVHSFIEDARPLYLFDILGLSARRRLQCPGGFFQASRELLLYTDQSGRPLETFDDPISGRQCRVVHTTNDPVNLRIDTGGERFAFISADGKHQYGSFPDPIDLGEFYSYSQQAFPFYPLPGWSHPYMSAELFSYKVGKSVIESLEPSVAIDWSRVGPALPFMNADGAEPRYRLVYHASGCRVYRWSDVPNEIRSYVETHYPGLREAPESVDTAAANQTSWTRRPVANLS